MKQLLIKSCSDSSLWYRDLVGQTVPLLKMPVFGEYLSREPSGFTNIVRECDAEVVLDNCSYLC